MIGNKKIRVLIVDDSAIIRQILKEGISKDPALEVVATAVDPYDARDKIVAHRPDVLTLDVEMPRMDGVHFLQKLMPQYPIPTIMVSSLTEHGKAVTIAALQAGAVDFVTKPSASAGDDIGEFIRILQEKLKMAAFANVSHWRNKPAAPAPKEGIANYALHFKKNVIIALGASTGGTEAIRTIIAALPANAPAVVIVQHMPAGFTKLYANGLNESSEMEVIEGNTGDAIIPGRVIIAPGGKQMTVKKLGPNNWQVVCEPGEKVNGHCPSVDVMFNSVAKEIGVQATGILLTGMGRDGALGMVEMKKVGIHNITQDEASCVVYGMPKAAVDLKASSEILTLSEIAPALVRRLRE